MADTQEPQASTPAATELSVQEWEEQLNAGYAGESAQPTGGEGTTPTQAPPKPTGNPAVRWIKNFMRSAPDAANAAARTAAETSVSVTRSPNARFALRNVPLVGAGLEAAAAGVSSLVGDDPEKAKQVEVVSEAQIQAVYGPKPSDLTGQIIHGTGQFIAGAVPFLASGVGLPVAGAASLGIAFDPYEDTASDLLMQHREFIEKVPIAGRILTSAASALSVEDDDSPIEARIKKTIEGEVIGKLTGFILTPVVRAIAVKTGLAAAVKSGATKAETNMARITASAQAELERMRAPRPTDVVEVVPGAEPGVVEVRPVQRLREPAVTGGRPSSAVQSFNNRTNEVFGFTPGEDPVIRAADGSEIARLKTTNKGGDVVEIELVENLSGQKGAASQALERLTQLADEEGVTLSLQASPLKEGLSPEKLRDVYRRVGFEQTKAGEANMVRRPRDLAPDFREVDAGGKATYSDPAAAAGDAAMANAAAYEISREGTMFTPDEVRLHFATAEALGKGDVGALALNPHFNLQSMGTTEAVDVQIAALTTQYGDMLSVAQGRPGVPNEVLHDAARRWAAEVHLDNFLPAVAAADAAGRVNLSLKASLFNAANKQAAQEVAEIGMLMSAKPGDDALEMLARRRLETWLRVAEATANFNTELGRGLQALSARNAASAAAIRFGSGVAVRESITQGAAQAPKVFMPLNPQNLSPEKLAALVRLFTRSGGDVRVAHFVNETMKKELAYNVAEWNAKGLAGKVESRLVGSFISSIISGFKTFATIATSGATLNGFQASAKILAGAGTLNKGLAEEGAAQMASLFYYSRANMRGAWAAFKENRSIIDGTHPFSVDPSKIMKGIQAPGRVAGSLDEFTRQAAYRADEFATGFRAARDEGLSLAEAARQADMDVNKSIDAQTGIGLNAAALKRAGIPTLSDNLGNDTFMGKISNVLAEYPYTKFAVPFIRPSVNTFRFAWRNAPVLNRFNRESARILAEGGEAATVLHTQATLTGSMMLYAMSKWTEGEITGKGPSDPQLRNMWNKNHQPYSIRIGSEWVSYRRADPLSTFLGLVADTQEIFHEIPDQDRDEFEEKVGAAMGSVFSATMRNTTSKSWTESILNFLTAIDDKQNNGGDRYVRGILAGLVPLSSGIKQFNDDAVYRESREVVDGVRALFPGWSDEMPAQADWSGEVRARQGSLWNRNFSPFSSVEYKPEVEDVLVDNFIRLSPANPRPYPGIDMWDKKWARSDGKVPYEVYMEKMRATGIRKEVESMVNDPKSAFNQAPKGNRSYPDGLRADLVRQLVGAAQTDALESMLSEFPEFEKQYNVSRYVVPPVAKYEGAEAADSTKELYGIPTETK